MINLQNTKINTLEAIVSWLCLHLIVECSCQNLSFELLLLTKLYKEAIQLFV